MNPLDLASDPLAAAVRDRAESPPPPVVWIFDDARGLWCLLRRADPGGLIRTLCLAELDYEAVCVATSAPHNTCPACATELAARTPGSAVAVGRATTVDLRGERVVDMDDINEWSRP